jgi:pimeloyl-ACP methyl ester carboxylesterase
MQTKIFWIRGFASTDYSGSLDPYVPVSNFKEELDAVQSLTNVKYTNFNGTGHDGFFDEPQVWKELILQSQYKK